MAQSAIFLPNETDFEYRFLSFALSKITHKPFLNTHLYFAGRRALFESLNH
jgi:hypothetical protein